MNLNGLRFFDQPQRDMYPGIRALPKQRPDAQRSFNVKPLDTTIDPETFVASD